jgi:osmotically-inducible protein OsmY
VNAHAHYLVARVRQALAEDDRSAVLDVDVQLRAGKLFLIGPVESAAMREVVERVARELVPEEIDVVNQLWIAVYERPNEAEPLP